MNKKISIGIALSLILVAVTVTFTATMMLSMRLFDSKVSSAQERAQMYDKLSEIDKVVRQNYYAEIDDEAVSDALSRGMMNGLSDPASVYLTSAEIAERSEQMQGMSVSLGLSFEPDSNGYVVVSNIAAESPAEKMEMAIGDTITKINGEDVLVLGYEQAVERLNNCGEGEKVELVYNRSGEENSVDVTATSMATVAVVHSRIDDIYFIRIELVNDLTLNQFKDAVAAAEAETELSGIVLDLRDVFGGYDLSVVAGMLDRLLPNGTTVSGIYKDGESKVLYTSDEEAVSLPIAVMVNEGTVGFVELFAAVMREMADCTIIGRTTAGAGTLQQVVKLTDGSGVAVTVAELTTPNGEKYDAVGVAPDYAVSVPDTFIRVSIPSEQNDPQYAKAAEVVRAA